MRLIDEHALVIAGKTTMVDGEIYIKLDDVEKCLDRADTIQPQGIDKDRLIEELAKEKHDAPFTSSSQLDWNLAINKAVRIIKNQPIVNQQPQTGWIPCSERLPEELEPVNVTWVNRKPGIGYSEIKDIPFTATAVLCKGKWWWYSVYCEDYLTEYGKSLGDEMDKDIEVIAWQPLPPVYKESKNE